MTSRKTPKQDPQKDAEVIEGVAVEKPATRKKAPKSGPRAAGKAAASEQDGPTPAADNPSTSQPPQAAPAGRSRATSIIAIGLASLALVITIGSALMQRQSGADDQAELQSRIASLETALTSTSASASASLAQMAETVTRLQSEKAELAVRLDELAASIPADQSAGLTSLRAELQERLSTLETGVDVLTQQIDGSAGMSVIDGAGDTKLVLIRTALSAVTAMTAEMASGGRPERWLETLQSLSSTGLDLGDLDHLAEVMSPPPPTISDLLAQGSGLVRQIRDGAGTTKSDGWWQAATGSLSNFITLRAAEGKPAVGSTQLSDFEAALTAGDLRSAVVAAKMVKAVDGEAMSTLDGWVAEAQRRLVLDDSLVGLAASLSADLANLLTTEAAPVVEINGGGGDS